MEGNAPPLSFSRYLLLTLGVYMLFSVPTLAFLVAFRFMPLGFASFFFAVHGILAVPVAGALSWLRLGTDDSDKTPVSLMAACALPAQLFLFLAGGLVGAKIQGTVGGVVGAVLLFLAGKLLGFRVAQFIWRTLRMS